MALRMCCLARLWRLLRTGRTIKGFDKFYLMTTEIKGSVSVLAWSITLLTVGQTFIALFLQAVLDPYVTDAKPDALPDRWKV